MDCIKKIKSRRGNQVPMNDELETWSEKRERKNSLYIIHFTMFLMTLGFSIVLTGIWPYLKKLDPDADKDFLRYVIAANPFGQMIFSPLMGWWGNKKKSVRIPFIVTLAIFVIASTFYSVLDNVPGDNRRMYMMITRFFIGASAANIAIARSYISGATKASEKTHQVSMLALAQVLGFAIGPGIQAIVTPLGEDGYDFLGLKFNMFTTPGWINALMGILNIILFLPWFFKEHKIAARESMKIQGKSTEKEAWKELKPDFWAAVTLIFCNFVLVFNFVLLEALATPLTMEQFAWTEQESMTYMGWLMCIGAFIACIIFLAIEPICKIFAERKVMLWGGFCMLLIGRILYIPWGPGLPKIAQMNSTITSTINSTINITFENRLIPGCPSTQQWCYEIPAMTITQFIIGYGFTTLGYPIGVTLAQTIYSKILGPRPQGLWMGAMTGAGSSSRVMGPIIVIKLYTSLGTYWTWGVTGLTLVVAMIGIIIVDKRLIPKIPDKKIKHSQGNKNRLIPFIDTKTSNTPKDIEMQPLHGIIKNNNQIDK